MDDTVDQAAINAADEQVAVRLYAAIATNPDIGAHLYTKIEDLIETSINQDDMVLVTGCEYQNYFSPWFNLNIPEPERIC